MLSSSRPAKAGGFRFLSLLVIAALTIAVRLPFLLHGDRFFDSDEAVEGLMARHVLQGEWPIYLWGQHYKGVPEVYVNAAVFRVVGSSVIALKATTLAGFVAFACLQFLLLERLFSTRIAWMGTLVAITGPPTLVVWTLSANAEIVWTMLAGTVMGLALVRWRDSGSTAALALAAAAVGFGLWVHQYMAYYVVALAVLIISSIPASRAWLRDVVTGRLLPRWLRPFAWFVVAVAVGYVLLGVAAFVTGGFDTTVDGVFISMHSPQRLWRIASALLVGVAGASAIVQLLSSSQSAARGTAAACAIGFAIGYAPAIATNLLGEGRLSPLGRMDAGRLTTVSASLWTEMTPMVLGFRGPLTDWLPVSPWFALVFAVVLAASLPAVRSRRLTPFFHIYLVVVPVVFLVSGSFVDAQSYRYLMPVYAALPVTLAMGLDAIWRWNRGVATTALCAVLAIFLAQQAAWFLRLAPDVRSPALVACLGEHGLKGARADYWISYKVTFLTNERLILSPTNGIDRYPPYTSFVNDEGGASSEEACGSVLLQ